MSYLQQHFPQHTPDDAGRAIENLRRLQRLNIGDEATVNHRAAIIETLEKVRQQAEANAAESDQRSHPNEDSQPNHSHRD